MKRRRINLTKASLPKWFVKLRRTFFRREKSHRKNNIEQEYD